MSTIDLSKPPFKPTREEFAKKIIAQMPPVPKQVPFLRNHY